MITYDTFRVFFFLYHRYSVFGCFRNKKDISDRRLMEPQPLVDSIFASPECIASAGSPPASAASGGKKRAEKSPARAKKYKKAPGAPRRFKSAFIFFSIDKHRTIRESMSVGGQKEKVSP